jgi:2-iminobutanoate/2-iminopropanoate deaminase
LGAPNLTAFPGSSGTYFFLTDNDFLSCVEKGEIMKVINTKAAPAAIGPYSQAYITGGLIFASGQIPLSPETGEVVGKTVAEQAEQVIKNLKSVLEAGGSSLEQVIKTTCFLVDMNDFSSFNEVYAKHFPGKPARSAVAVKQLPRSVLIEIEAVAELSDR